MSHFTVLVIGDNPEDQLAPFDESIEVKPYKEKCYCVGRIAENDAYNQTQKKYKSMDKLRDEYASLPEKNKPTWLKYIQPFIKVEKKLCKAHKLYNKPDKKCTECKGTGIRITTYNPDSKWDWYSLGGRWRGYFKLKEGRKGNLGAAGVFDNKATFDADQAFKKDIDFSHKKMKEIATFAVIKDGKWYERGDMGWWGMVKNEKEESVWEKEFKKLLDEVPDNTLLSVYDCHI